MAISVSHSIEISATPQLVWEVFTDIYSWSKWNPLIVDVHQITGGSVWIPGGMFIQKYKSDFIPEEIITKSVVREVFPARKVTWLGEVLGSNGVTSYEFVPFGPKTVVAVTEEFAETQSSQLNFVIGAYDRQLSQIIVGRIKAIYRRYNWPQNKKSNEQ